MPVRPPRAEMPPKQEEILSLRYHNPVAIRFGAGSIAELPAVLAGRRAVLVTFPEAEGLGLAARLRSLLGPALAGVVDRIEPNPDVANLSAMYESFWREHAAVEAIIGVGGGSAMDTAKALMVGTASGRFDELVALLAKGGAFKPYRVKSLIAVPSVYPSSKPGPISCRSRSVKGRKVWWASAAIGLSPVLISGRWHFAQPTATNTCSPVITSASLVFR